MRFIFIKKHKFVNNDNRINYYKYNLSLNYFSLYAYIYIYIFLIFIYIKKCKSFTYDLCLIRNRFINVIKLTRRN